MICKWLKSLLCESDHPKVQDAYILTNDNEFIIATSEYTSTTNAGESITISFWGTWPAAGVHELEGVNYQSQTLSIEIRPYPWDLSAPVWIADSGRIIIHEISSEEPIGSRSANVTIEDVVLRPYDVDDMTFLATRTNGPLRRISRMSFDVLAFGA
jgi:hypothetical protein